MDKLIGQFSLQNILRQMFCGVVFLLPLFLFSSIAAQGNKPANFQEVCNGLHKLNLSAVEFTCLAVLSVIVGTLIYHFEKNIWSYGLQALFMRFQKKREVNCAISVLAIILLLASIIFVIIIVLKSISGMGPILICAMSLSFLSSIISMYCISSGEVDATKELWLAEGGVKIPQDGESFDEEGAKIIMKKIASWSNFIHCGQSCAWAWIFGCLFAYVLYGENLVSKNIFWEGIASAILLLVAEAFIDWHRWQHVQKVLDFRLRKKKQIASLRNKLFVIMSHRDS